MVADQVHRQAGEQIGMWLPACWTVLDSACSRKPGKRGPQKGYAVHCCVVVAAIDWAQLGWWQAGR
jgi:hypothetical protein